MTTTPPVILALAGAILHQKSAGDLSNGLGRYLATGPVRRAVANDAPGASFGGVLGGALIPFGPYVGTPEMGQALLTGDGDDKQRAEQMIAASQQHKDRSYGDAFSKGVSGGWPAILLHALLGAGAGGYAGATLGAGSGAAVAGAAGANQGGILGGGVGGGVAGGLLGASLGGLGLGGLSALTHGATGAYDKAILSHMDKETMERTAKAKARNRYLSSFPIGGDIAMTAFT